MRLGVLASHGGTTLQAIIDAITETRLDAEVALLISNNSKSGAMDRARTAGIPTAHISGSTHPDDKARDCALRDALLAAGVELVVLAGYMKPLGDATLAAFNSRIINTHPSLLPKFGGVGFFGIHVHTAVIAAGEKVTGASVHLVRGDYDTGPVIAQRELPVFPEDTPESLQERVKTAEQALLIDVIKGWKAESVRGS